MKVVQLLRGIRGKPMSQAKKRSLVKKKDINLSMVSEDKRWRARDDLRTLQTALEIQNDKSRINAAQKEAQAQIQALSKVKAS